MVQGDGVQLQQFGKACDVFRDDYGRVHEVALEQPTGWTKPVRLFEGVMVPNGKDENVDLIYAYKGE